MAFAVYDYRSDLRNILVTPQIRSRFLQIDVGAISGGSRQGQGHSHDLGHEIFLILQGQAEFEIDGSTRLVQPGQLCVALVDEVHTVRNVGDVPVIMYLSVTPHIQPTHTFWSADGQKLPPRFNPAHVYDDDAQTNRTFTQLLETQESAFAALAATFQQAQEAYAREIEQVRSAAAAGAENEVRAARDALWSALFPMFKQMFDFADAWNSLTYRTAAEKFLQNDSAGENSQ